MDVFKRGTGILPVKNVRFPMKYREESRARCPCHALSRLSHAQASRRRFIRPLFFIVSALEGSIIKSESSRGTKTVFSLFRQLRCSRAVAALALLLASKVAAQQETVSWDFSLDPTTARRGEVVTMHLSATPKTPWYIYSHTLKATGPTPTQFKFDLPPGVQTLGTIEAPEPNRKFDQGFQAEVEYYHNPVVFLQKVLVGDSATTGQLQIKGKVRFQSCTETSCMPPKDVPFDLPLTVESGPSREEFRAPAMAQESRNSVTTQGIGEAVQSGFLAFLLLAILQGFLALTTPCVYPMIPITVSFFLKQGEREGRRPVLLATTYAASIIATFTSVGLLLALVYGPAGTSRLGASPIANLVLGILFIAFALSLFGLFEIQVPASLQNYFASKGRSGGYGGTIFMGIAFTLASLACTAPFIGALLGLAAGGQWLWPLVGMLGFSFAFALPFFVLALFPQFLARMPRSGGWLNSVKVVMGFLVLAVSLKFLANSDAVWNWQVFTRPVILASWTMIAAFTGFYLLGMIRLPHDTPLDQVGVGRMLLSLAFLAFGLYLAAGLFGRKINGTLDAFLPSDVGQVGNPSSVSPPWLGQVGNLSYPLLQWLDDYSQALQRAKAERKPVLIDFTGVTCTNCKWMERNILARDDVARTMERFVLVRLYTDSGPNRSENEQMQVKRFGTAALPFYAIMSPDDRELARLAGLTRDPERFLAFLAEGLARLE
jgi:thiol:disulfide interchange protein DsbD